MYIYRRVICNLFFSKLRYKDVSENFGVNVIPSTLVSISQSDSFIDTDTHSLKIIPGTETDIKIEIAVTTADTKAFRESRLIKCLFTRQAYNI